MQIGKDWIKTGYLRWQLTQDATEGFINGETSLPLMWPNDRNLKSYLPSPFHPYSVATKKSIIHG
jgi:hypothetical protein